LFNKADQRGFWQYTKISLTEFAKYKPQQYEISIDGKRITEQAFIVCVANGSQYGNNAYIAPTANIQDGIFEITLIKPFKIWQTPLLGMNLFNKSLHQSALSKVYCGKEIYIKQPASGIVNIDGEPVELSKDLHVKMHHKGLKIIIP
jgi:diacylglycerol kinase family enzyme